jgi:DegV family protein with EDD domain
MPHTAVITDTDASLPAPLAARYGIRQVPIVVQFGDEALQTTVDIDDASAFARIEREGRLPTTSAPPPAAFAQAFEAALGDGATSILCFCVSAAVSATHNSALIARDLYPGRDIRVVDSGTISMAIGFQALAAARAVEAGATPDEALAAASSVAARASVYATLTTLKYLAMSGRVGHLAAGMAGLLDVKPILTVRDGKLDILERVRSRARSWSRVLELTRQMLAGRVVEEAAVLHVAVPQDAERLKKQLLAEISCPSEVVVAELTPGLSIHGGPGMVGVVVVAAEK